jgi:hypothetical protein
MKKWQEVSRFFYKILKKFSVLEDFRPPAQSAALDECKAKATRRRIALLSLLRRSGCEGWKHFVRNGRKAFSVSR